MSTAINDQVRDQRVILLTRLAIRLNRIESSTPAKASSSVVDNFHATKTSRPSSTRLMNRVERGFGVVVRSATMASLPRRAELPDVAEVQAALRCRVDRDQDPARIKGSDVAVIEHLRPACHNDGVSAVLRRARLLACPLAAFALHGCAGAQSAFAPFGAEAESTRVLAMAMAAAAAVILVAVLALATYAVRARKDPIDARQGTRLILWLGAIVPTVLLTLLLVIALPAMRKMASAPLDLHIAVTGEQFWWRVRYLPTDRTPVETANEIRVPVGRTVVFTLASADVVHSFWVPGLAGKVDMIPGRTNRLVVKATRAGVFRGVCAEFCGLSHARMAFDVIAMPPVAFDRWLGRAGRPAVVPASAGLALFDSYGCNGCHRLGGPARDGAIGPDLTDFANRRSFAAGSPKSINALADFIRNPRHLKPGVKMPAFDAMPPSDARALAVYLQELR